MTQPHDERAWLQQLVARGALSQQQAAWAWAQRGAGHDLRALLATLGVQLGEPGTTPHDPGSGSWRGPGPGTTPHDPGSGSWRGPGPGATPHDPGSGSWRGPGPGTTPHDPGSGSGLLRGGLPGADGLDPRSASGRVGRTTRADGSGDAQGRPGERVDLLASTRRGGLGKVGRYELRGTLGEGGFGAVFRGVDPATGQEVAIKVLLRLDGTARGRFAREVEAARRLEHEGIVPVLEHGEEQGRPYLVMELAAGATLDALCTPTKRLPVRAVARILRDAARTMEHAHGLGILHRDVKPQNVMFDEEAGRARLLDFGLARLADDRERLTRTGASVGTPAYMAPEQIVAKLGAVDARTDVYGLGATLYHALTGRPPFLADSQLELVGRIIDVRPEPPSQHAPEVPKALDAICLRALEKDPARRQQTAGELAQDLARWLEGRLDAAPPPAARRPGRAAAPLALGAAAVAVLIGVAAVFVTRRGAPDGGGEGAGGTPGADAPGPGPEGPPRPGAVDPGPVVADALTAAERAGADLDAIARDLAAAPGVRPALLAELARLDERLERSRAELLRGGALLVEGPDRARLAAAAERELARPRAARTPHLELSDLDELIARILAPARAARPGVRWGMHLAQVQAAAVGEAALRRGDVAWRALVRTGLDDPAVVVGLSRHLVADARDGAVVDLAAALLVGGGDEGLAAVIERLGEAAEGPLAQSLTLPDPRGGPLDEPLLLLRARLRFRGDAFEAGRADIEQLLARVPGHPIALCMRGQLFLNAGRFEEALRDAEAALEAEPRFPFAHLMRGLARQSLGLPGVAEDTDRAVELAPNDPSMHFYRALSRLRRGDLDGADADLSFTLGLEPDNARAYMLRGTLLLERRDPDGAREDLERAVTLARDARLLGIDHVTLGTNLARARSLTGASLHEVLEPLDEALLVGGEHVELRAMRASVLLDVRRLDEAAADIAKARGLARTEEERARVGRLEARLAEARAEPD